MQWQPSSDSYAVPAWSYKSAWSIELNLWCVPKQLLGECACSFHSHLSQLKSIYLEEFRVWASLWMWMLLLHGSWMDAACMLQGCCMNAAWVHYENFCPNAIFIWMLQCHWVCNWASLNRNDNRIWNVHSSSLSVNALLIPVTFISFCIHRLQHVRLHPHCSGSQPMPNTVNSPRSKHSLHWWSSPGLWALHTEHNGRPMEVHVNVKAELIILSDYCAMLTFWARMTCTMLVSHVHTHCW